MRYKILFLLLVLFFVNPAKAIEEDVIGLDEDVRIPEFHDLKGYIEESPYVFGDYKNIRTKLSERGIDIQSSYIIDSFAMRNQEKRVSKGTYQGLYNLSLDLDSEKLGLYKGGKLHVLYQAGNKGLSSIDFLNSYSDISSYNPSRSINQISELYYEHSKDDLFSIKIGKQDANVDFQALDTGFEFLNLSFSYFDNTPMPLFPSQQMGVRARLRLKDDIYIQNGFYDGNLKIGANPKTFFTGKNNYLDMTEIYKLTNFKGKSGKYLIGNWLKTGKYETFNDTTRCNNYGFYIGFEQKLIDRFDDKSGGLSMFSQFGYARNSINDVPYYYGAGLVFKGITEKRKDDSIGLAFGWHQFDKELNKANNQTAESVVELFYKIKLTNFLYIQPDIQYIIKPSGNEKNAIAVGLRSCIVF
ncbi:MAG: carbohydrate porin [Candidatus Gastranaerophilales bacterium]|nr:carbohydrate porin [Candidatus Gastranaerophilales bacterium]